MENRDIGVFKLTTGEELISEYAVDENMKDLYVLRKPRLVYLQPIAQNKFALRLKPWIDSQPDGIFPVYAGHVLTVSVEIDESLRNGYIAETTGIDMSQATTQQKLVGV